jgi:hypothetical protein
LFWVGEKEEFLIEFVACQNGFGDWDYDFTAKCDGLECNV